MTHSLLGLCFLHRNDRSHRDIKPDNLMCRDGVWKLGDLGMVQVLASNSDISHSDSGTMFIILYYIIFFFSFLIL